MRQIEDIKDIYTLVYSYRDALHVSATPTRCKCRYNTPVKAAKVRKKAKSKRRMVKQSRKLNR